MKERTYSESVAKAINDFLTKDNWRFTFDSQCGAFKFDLCLDGKLKRVCYTVRVRENEYVVYVYSPIGADSGNEKMMASMAEFICRANYGMLGGNFELDARDGEIRFKYFVDCEGIVPTVDMVRNSIYWPGAMIDQYGRGIADIVFQGMTAEEAIKECEGDDIDDILASLSNAPDSEEAFLILASYKICRAA